MADVPGAVAGVAARALSPFVKLGYGSYEPKPAAPKGPMPSAEDSDWNALAEQARTAAGWLGGQMPSPDDPRYANDPEQYNIDFMTWQEMFGTAANTARTLQEWAFGYQTLPDGTIIGLDQMPPEMRAAAEASNRNQFIAMQNALGLQTAKLEDDRKQARFNNEVTLLDQAMERDDLRLSQAEQKINRQLSGMAESRARADLVSGVKQRAAPYTTRDGKTSFSANDLGSAVGSLASFVGVDPGSSLLNYGSTLLDPEGDMARFDEGMGVAGLLAEVPELASLLLPSPTAPDFGGTPALQGYVDPRDVLAGIGRDAARGSGNAVASGAASLASSLGLTPPVSTDSLVAPILQRMGWDGGGGGGGGAPTWQDPGTMFGLPLGTSGILAGPTNRSGIFAR